MMLRPPPPTTLAACALLAALPAGATGTVRLLDRESVSQVLVVGGIGSSSVAFPCLDDDTDLCEVTGSNGSLAVLSGPATPTVSLAGSGSGMDTSLVFTTWLDATWSQTQTYSFTQQGGDAVLQASGALNATMTAIGSNGIDPPIPATKRLESWNWQAFHFRLDQAAAYALVGGSTGGQQLEMWWTAPGGAPVYQSFVIGNTGATSFSNAGVLQAGTYLLRNFRFVMASVENQYANSWDYTLTLGDTQITAVPEPGSAALWAGALAVLGLRWGSRRAGWAR